MQFCVNSVKVLLISLIKIFMKNYLLIRVVAGLLLPQIYARAGDLYQTFESGEDTSNWNSTWSNGTVVSGFLDSSLGGLNAGSGDSSQQTYSRDFSHAPGIIDVTQPYYISLYVQVDTANLPADGQFDIIDGQYGSRAADVHVGLEDGQLVWQTGLNNSYQDIGLNASLANPYWIMMAVDPTAKTYSVTVAAVDTLGNVLGSPVTVNNLAGDQNAFNNHANGNLTVYLQASAGSASIRVDNLHLSDSPISTTATPEPSTMALTAAGFAAVFYLKRSRSQHS